MTVVVYHIYMSRRKTRLAFSGPYSRWDCAHHFYLGHTLIGVVFALFCWTFIPLLISIIELFLMRVTGKNHNRHVAQNVLSEIELIG